MSNPLPEAPKAFIPQAINPSTRSRQRRGHGPPPTRNLQTNETEVMLINTNFDSKAGNDKKTLGNSHSRLSDSGSNLSSSVVFAEDDILFDELDILDPHEHEGGVPAVDPNIRNNIVSSRRSSTSTAALLAASMRAPYNGVTRKSGRSEPGANFSTGQYVPTDYNTLMASTTGKSLSEIINKLDERHKASTTFSQKHELLRENSDDRSRNEAMEHIHSQRVSSRESVVGGKNFNDLSLEEQCALFDRSEENLIKDDSSQVTILSSVDWSSLTKSCKCAKYAFRDADYSGQQVVMNMFTTHLNALVTLLTHYTQTHSKDELSTNEMSTAFYLENIKSLTVETKRALRFALACLSPSHSNDAENSTALSSLVLNQSTSSTMAGSKPVVGFDSRHDVERYRSVRRYRQELQDVAVGSDDKNCHMGLHLLLVDIIMGKSPGSHSTNSSKRMDDVRASIEKDEQTIIILAARVLCNLVTDNPVAAELVLMDIPFGPTFEETERMLSLSFSEMQSNDSNHVSWSNLIVAAAKLGSPGHDSDREALAAVAAALHNLLASLETRDSLIELDHKFRLRENLKLKRAKCRRTSSMMNGSEDDMSHSEPSDAGFDAVVNQHLINSLLRYILPAHGVMMQSRSESFGEEKAGRPKFLPPSVMYDHSHSFEDTSDSATEWISLLIERLASRGLLPQIFLSAGGKSGKGSITPEQVVLVSCIRQAVDDYYSSRTLSGETGEFGRRRLSIAAKSAGVTLMTRPHPLWGRVNDEFIGVGLSVSSPTEWGRPSGNENNQRSSVKSTAVVPVLLFLANEVDYLYSKVKTMHITSTESYSGELSCTVRVIDDIRDIISHCLVRHAESVSNDEHNSEKNKQSILAETRSVLGRETSLMKNCLFDLAKIIDSALSKIAGKTSRDLSLTYQDQHSLVVLVRLIGNVIHQCHHNQNLLRTTQVPLTLPPEKSHSDDVAIRTGLHVILTATSLAPACLTLREWCIMAIRNAVENNEANAAEIQRLEAHRVLRDTSELNKLGINVGIDSKGKVNVRSNRGD